jgi:hypothetical protein
LALTVFSSPDLPLMTMPAAPHPDEALAVVDALSVVDPALVLHQHFQARAGRGHRERPRPVVGPAFHNADRRAVDEHLRPVPDTVRLQERRARGRQPRLVEHEAEDLAEFLHGQRARRGHRVAEQVERVQQRRAVGERHPEQVQLLRRLGQRGRGHAGAAGDDLAEGGELRCGVARYVQWRVVVVGGDRGSVGVLVVGAVGEAEV